MNPLLLGMFCCWSAVADRTDRDERGDVPGWVLVTVVKGA